MAYLDVNEFKLRTIMPSTQVDRIEATSPGWLAANLESSSRWTDMHLAKRYRVPFISSARVQGDRYLCSKIVSFRNFDEDLRMAQLPRFAGLRAQ